MTTALSLDPATYTPHAIHGSGRVWAETNCYTDMCIELLHALGHDPTAALPFTFASDFEGDQWTFFKFPAADLEELFGVIVQELVIWRPLPDHLEEQLDRGRPVLVELDSRFLPDTAGTAYHRTHEKSTAAVMEIDRDRRHLRYFHNQGLYSLGGEDFVDVMRLREPQDPARLPPYAEIVKLDRSFDGGDATLDRSVALLRRHLRLAPEENPFVSFHARLSTDLDVLLNRDLAAFHQYSFAMMRQFGACYELSATYLQWLIRHGETGLEDAARAFQDIAAGAKTFEFKLARAVSRRQPLSLSSIETMAERWAAGMSDLRTRYL
jgi:hypothetical protein